MSLLTGGYIKVTVISQIVCVCITIGIQSFEANFFPAFFYPDFILIRLWTLFAVIS